VINRRVKDSEPEAFGRMSYQRKRAFGTAEEARSKKQEARSKKQKAKSKKQKEKTTFSSLEVPPKKEIPGEAGFDMTKICLLCKIKAEDEEGGKGDANAGSKAPHRTSE
jgi:hypothetical protein